MRETREIRELVDQLEELTPEQRRQAFLQLCDKVDEMAESHRRMNERIEDAKHRLGEHARQLLEASDRSTGSA